MGLPLWVVLFTVAAGALLVIGPAVAPSAVLMASSVGVMTGLLMSRSIGVVTGDWKREGLGAATLIVASVIALWMAAQHNPHCVRVLAVGRRAGGRCPVSTGKDDAEHGVSARRSQVQLGHRGDGGRRCRSTGDHVAALGNGRDRRRRSRSVSSPPSQAR